MKLGIFYSNPRLEEKELFTAAERDKGLELVRIKDDEITFDFSVSSPLTECDVVLLRSQSHTKNYYAAKFIETSGGIAVNDFHTIATCGDKFLTTAKLIQYKVPTPATKVCVDSEQALRTIEEWGYPVVLKPVVGSWGRLLSKINDREAAETVLEHKTVLGGIMHANLFYIQEYIEKKAKRDIRAAVIGNEVVAAMYRTSDHWITNTARGGATTSFQIDAEFTKLVLQAAKAVNEHRPEGGLLGIDLIETERGLEVVEVNSGVEFHGLKETTSIDIPGKMIEFCKSLVN
jgi:[lysine-biosynthesis-protein LysW]--L-2-aminoadipate ligase